MWADRTMSAVQARQRSAADVMEHHPSKVLGMQPSASPVLHSIADSRVVGWVALHLRRLGTHCSD